MKPRHLALALLVNVIWGVNFVAIKMAVTHFPPLFFSFLRFALVALLLGYWLRVQPGRMRQVLLVALTLGVLHFALFFLGVHLAEDVSSAAIVVQLNVPFATLLAVIFLGERIGWRRGLAIGVAFVGVIVIGFDPRAFGYVDALAIMTVAAFVLGLSQVLMRGLRGVRVFPLQAWIAAVSAPAMLVLSLLFERGQAETLRSVPWEVVGAVLYTAVLASVVGHGAAYFLIRRYPVTMVSPMFLLVPLFGVASGVIVLGDVVTLQIAAGGLLTIGGVAVITLRTARRAKRAEAPTPAS